MENRIASAVFDSREEAERALTELRSMGVTENAISIVGRGDEGGGAGSEWSQSRSYDNENETGADKGDVVKGAAIGTGAGAVLGIAALAIPGVGPLVAAGAIAASAIPTAAAIGAGAGLAAGSVAGLLASHGVDEEDSKYYEERLTQGGIFVSVSEEAGVPIEDAREVLFRNGGHSATRARTTDTVA